MTSQTSDLTIAFLRALPDYVCAAIYVVCIVMLGIGFSS